MAQWTQQTAQGIDLASKFPRSQSNWASTGYTGASQMHCPAPQPIMLHLSSHSHVHLWRYLPMESLWGWVSNHYKHASMLSSSITSAWCTSNSTSKRSPQTGYTTYLWNCPHLKTGAFCWEMGNPKLTTHCQPQLNHNFHIRPKGSAINISKPDTTGHLTGLIA